MAEPIQEETWSIMTIQVPLTYTRKMCYTTTVATLTTLEYLAVTHWSTTSLDIAIRSMCKTTENQVRIPITLPCGYGLLHQLVAHLTARFHLELQSTQ